MEPVRACTMELSPALVADIHAYDFTRATLMREWARLYPGSAPLTLFLPPQAYPVDSEKRRTQDWTMVVTDDPIGWAHMVLGPMSGPVLT